MHAQAVFAGTPFRPHAPRWIEQVSLGCPVGWNDKLLTAKVQLSFTAGYSFLPHEGQGLFTKDGQEVCSMVLSLFSSDHAFSHSRGFASPWWSHVTLCK